MALRRPQRLMFLGACQFMSTLAYWQLRICVVQKNSQIAEAPFHALKLNNCLTRSFGVVLWEVMPSQVQAWQHKSRDVTTQTSTALVSAWWRS